MSEDLRGAVIAPMLVSAIASCAQPPPRASSECHVLKADEIIENLTGPEAMRTKWLAWCGEGRYVVFTSSVSAGQVLRFTEYQEDNQLRIYGAIEGPK